MFSLFFRPVGLHFHGIRMLENSPAFITQRIENWWEKMVATTTLFFWYMHFRDEALSGSAICFFFIAKVPRLGIISLSRMFCFHVRW